MYQFYISSHFKKQIKSYLKKFRSLLDDIVVTLESFNPENHAPLGHDTYKIRLRSSDLPKGKNKSFRLIVLLMVEDNLLVPLAIYLKNDQDTITKQEILEHIETIKREISLV